MTTEPKPSDFEIDDFFHGALGSEDAEFAARNLVYYCTHGDAWVPVPKETYIQVFNGDRGLGSLLRYGMIQMRGQKIIILPKFFEELQKFIKKH